MMTTLQLLVEKPNVPTTTAWYLADLGEARGKQELFTKQSPQRLKVLREHALIESAVSSNRIEGVTVDQSRVKAVVLGKSLLRDRDEEEVRGYRDALKLIHEQHSSLSISEKTIKQLHFISRAKIGDAGKYKTKDSDIIEKSPDGRSRIRFKTVPAKQTAGFVRELVKAWSETLDEKQVHPLVAMAALNLDFLCIHPFRDGNGRVSRLLLLLMFYQLGFEVGRYISLERLIEENKDRYYETLEESSQGWHEGKHDPWPFVNYLLFILKHAYREFEERVGQLSSPRGSKTEMIISAIDRSVGSFRVADIQRQCPGVSLDMIRKVLKDLRSQVECLGRGKDAKWEKTAKWELGND
jgi:Fic family protein